MGEFSLSDFRWIGKGSLKGLYGWFNDKLGKWSGLLIDITLGGGDLSSYATQFQGFE